MREERISYDAGGGATSDHLSREKGLDEYRGGTGY